MPVLAVEHVRPMRGGAQSHLMRADDGHYYVVKFTNNPQGRRILANELLAARLARGLGLPVPPAALVEVPPSLVDRSPSLVLRIQGSLVPCASGLQFGSRFPLPDPHAPIWDYLPEPGLEMIANRRDFAGMLVFDKWTCNCNGRQVIFCRPGPRRPLQVFMVDQGFCFDGENWEFPDSPLRGVYCRNTVYSSISGWPSFEPWLGKLESYDVDAIHSLADEVPPAWTGGYEALAQLLTNLVRRRQRVRELIWQVKVSARAPFENWLDAAPQTAEAAGAGGA